MTYCLRPRALQLCALLAALAGARTGLACENGEVRGDVVGVTDNGSFVRYQTSVFQEQVQLLNPEGKQLANCERETEEETGWQCRGAVPVKPGRKRPAAQVAASWLVKLGGTPLSSNKEVPAGVADLFCVHLTAMNPNTGSRFSCSSGSTELLTHKRTSTVFFRYRFDFHFCGSDESHQDVEWMTRSALETRLRKRAASLSSQSKWKLAQGALEALVWLTHDPATEKELAAVKAKAAGGAQ